MSTEITNEIAEAVLQQKGKPLQCRDAAGKVYYVLTEQLFQNYAYDDSELTSDEMIASASQALHKNEDWGASNMNEYDKDDSEGKE